jgi:hypothetical protein
VLLRKARYEVEKNLSRLAADWRDRVAKIIDELTREAERQALDELAALGQMLAQSQNNAPQLQGSVAELQDAQNQWRQSSHK